jgi:cell division protein FtsL
MTPAELRYRYDSYEKYIDRRRESHVRYGIDMRPAAAPQPVKKAAPAQAGRGGKGLLLLIAVAAAALCLGVLFFSALEMSVKREINQALKATEELRGEIEALEVEIKSGTGLDLIERRAMEELGMVYPLPEQRVFLDEAQEPVNDFAQYIRENTYF